MSTEHTKTSGEASSGTMDTGGMRTSQRWVGISILTLESNGMRDWSNEGDCAC